jgi:hypothetical protein
MELLLLGGAGGFAFGCALGSAVKRIRRYRRTISGGHGQKAAQCGPSKEEQLEERFKKIDDMLNALTNDVGDFGKLQKENLVGFRQWRDAFRRHLMTNWDALEVRVNSQDQKLDEAICRYKEGSDAEKAWKKELEIKCSDLQTGLTKAIVKIGKMQVYMNTEKSASFSRINKVKASADAEINKLIAATTELQGKLSYLEQVIFSAAELVGYPAATDPNGANPNGANPNGADSVGVNPAPVGPTGAGPTGAGPVPIRPSGADLAAMTPLQARQEFLRRRPSGFGPNPSNAL